MSWLAPSIGLYIGVDHVIARLLPGRWHRLPALAQRQLCDREAAFGPVTPIEETLSALLEPSREQALQLHVVLADAHCRYLALPRPQGLRSRRELQQALSTRFHALYADAPQDWQLITHCDPGAAIDLVVGARRDLLTPVHAFCTERGFRLATVRPHWFAWSRHWRTDLRRGDHWLVCADGGWASVGYLSGGRCRHLRVLRTSTAPPPLAHLLAREQALHPQASERASVWTSGMAPAVLHGGRRLVQASVAELWRAATATGGRP